MGSNNSTPNYTVRKIKVQSKSDTENEEMAENFTMYAAGKYPRKKKFVTNLDDYPKFIKLVKSPVRERRHEALVQEQLPPQLIPQQIPLSTGNYRLLQGREVPRYSNQQTPTVAYFDWVPQHRIPNYNSYPQIPGSNLYKSYSYDGHTQNLAHIPLVRRNSQHFVSSPHGYIINDRNFYSRNTHENNVLVGNRGVNNSSRNVGPSQEYSASTSHQSAASSGRNTETGSEFYFPKEMDVETIEKFRDSNGTLIRLVKPIGSSTRIFNKANAPQMFMIVDHEYDTQSSPGRFVSDEIEESRISQRRNNSEQNSSRRSNNVEGNSSGRNYQSEEIRNSGRSNQSEEIRNSGKSIQSEDIRNSGRSNQNEENNSSNGRINNSEENRNSGKSNQSEENKSSRSSASEEKRRSRRSNKSEGREDIPEADESAQEEKEEEIPKEEESEAKEENQIEKENKIEPLKSNQEKSGDRKKDKKSYKEKIRIPKQVDVS